ncbi:MAG: MFS transporter [Rhodococcus sp. (in: high G+C Gram-positive bacteria)]|uniref:MFS transporter n=1 Tax=Rhodococcus sp. TaxID=1831 RepID=UPI002ADBC43A|nr:MFS transporter [Rhodococcus sp. (in: high G+C Gram-positive bacteria)]
MSRSPLTVVEEIRGRSTGLALAVVCAAQFMVVLDISVVNVALPSIRESLGFDSGGLAWVVNAYALTFAGFLLLGGRLADLLGRRRIFLIGLTVFSGASLVGGLVDSAALLVGARAIQGLGAAILAPATLTILTATFPEGPRRTRALATWTAVGIAGGTAGNLVGGVLTEYLTWRSTLLINVPIGLAAVLLTVRQIAADRPSGPRPRLDFAGAILATGGLGALAYGIAQAADGGWSTRPTIVGVVIGVSLLAAFVVVEKWVSSSPLIPLHIFRNRAVSVGNVVMLLAGACLNPMWYFLTLSMQNLLGYSPVQTGLAFLPHTVVAIAVGAGLTPWLMGRIDGRVLIAAGSLVAAAGFWWQAQLGADSSYLQGILLPAIVFSVGSGMLNTPITAAVTSGISAADAGAASGLMNTTKQIGGALGLSVLVAYVATSSTDKEVVLAAYNHAFYAIAAAMVVAAFVALALPAHRDESNLDGMKRDEQTE